MDKRLLRRVNVKFGSCLLMNNGFFIGTIENISLGGLFVKSDIQVKAMDRININILLLSDFGGINIEADVIATRIQSDGIALKYDRLDPEGLLTLQSYIHGSS